MRLATNPGEFVNLLQVCQNLGAELVEKSHVVFVYISNIMMFGLRKNSLMLVYR